MFHRHFEDYVRHGRHGGFGQGPFGWGRRGGGFGPREGRMFDGGELKLVILALIAEKPRHGYEIIKELGERVGGDYSPSPGVVYPTLTMLEEMGLASVSQDDQGRKLYAVTPEGEKALADSKPQLDAIFARFSEREEAMGRGGMGSVVRAMMNLRAATRLRLRSRSATPEQVQAIVDALDEAAKTNERSGTKFGRACPAMLPLSFRSTRAASSALRTPPRDAARWRRGFQPESADRSRPCGWD